MKTDFKFVLNGFTLLIIVIGIFAGFAFAIQEGDKQNEKEAKTERENRTIIAVVVETATDMNGRFGMVIYVEEGRNQGMLKAVSTGAEGEAFHSCDKVRLECFLNERDVAPIRRAGGQDCEGKELLTKFLGTPEECRAQLLEQGILSSGGGQ